jgi:hypothetical protein
MVFAPVQRSCGARCDRAHAPRAAPPVRPSAGPPRAPASFRIWGTCPVPKTSPPGAWGKRRRKLSGPLLRKGAPWRRRSRALCPPRARDLARSSGARRGNRSPIHCPLDVAYLLPSSICRPSLMACLAPPFLVSQLRIPRNVCDFMSEIVRLPGQVSPNGRVLPASRVRGSTLSAVGATRPQ